MRSFAFPLILLVLLSGRVTAQTDSSFMSLDAALKNPLAVKKLWLYHQGVIPAAIGSLVNLEFLQIQQGYANDLPAEIALLKNLRELHIQGNYFKTIPECVTQLPRLEVLDVSNNLLLTIPGSIGNLKSLRQLDISWNRVNFLPAEIGNMASLQILDISSNRLLKLPKEIGNLAQLKELDAGGNGLKELPDETGNLAALKKLELFNNRLTETPEAIARLSNLEDLSLSRNLLIKVPVSIWLLPKLRIFYIAMNGMKEFPDDLSACKIEFLALHDCRLEKFPGSITQIPHLKTLWMSDNSIDSVPGSITNLIYLQHLSIDGNDSALWLPPTFFSMKLQGLSVDPAVYERYKTEFDTKVIPDIEYFRSGNIWIDRTPSDGIFAPGGDYIEPSRSKRYAVESRVYFKSLKGAICKSDSVRVLDLSYHWNDSANINHGYIDSLPYIEELYFCGRHYKRLPFTGINFKHLRVLDLSETPIDSFPAEFAHLDSLRELNLAMMNLQTIPEFVFQLKQLERLDLSGNKSLIITKDIKRLRHLKQLTLDHRVDEEMRKKINKWLPDVEVVYRYR